ncbi:MAG: hypothetical protein F9K30_07725 [Dechloromonas sp.]|nr:MAG: hypothetical protein F9K30_07725 [Dechloromonas sp.]
MDDLKCRYRLNGPLYVFSMLFFGIPAGLYGMAAAEHKFAPFYPHANLFRPTSTDIYVQWGICAIFTAALIYGETSGSESIVSKKEISLTPLSRRLHAG